MRPEALMLVGETDKQQTVQTLCGDEELGPGVRLRDFKPLLTLLSWEIGSELLSISELRFSHLADQSSQSLVSWLRTWDLDPETLGSDPSLANPWLQEDPWQDPPL